MSKGKVAILAEDVDLSALNPKTLTNDCMLVHILGGRVDVAQSKSMTAVFDEFHDAGHKITSIEHAGGSLNPKYREPAIE